MSVAKFRMGGGVLSALLVGLLTLACGDPKPSPTPSVGSNTNWLSTCDADAECDQEQACRCGVCTLACSDDDACRKLPNASCTIRDERAFIASCGDEVTTSLEGVCLPRCAAGSCGEGQACVEGTCVIVPIPESNFCAAVVESSAAQRAREDQLLELVFAERAGEGKTCGSVVRSAAPPLRLDPRLNCAARVLARENDARSGLGKASERRLSDAFPAAGYQAEWWGLNVAIGAASPEDALQLMHNDINTCDRFTDPRFRDVGVGNAGESYIVTLAVAQ